MVTVEWTSTGTTNVYRVGHKGKVDLKYIQEAYGCSYYRDHLSVLGMSESGYTDSYEEKYPLISSAHPINQADMAVVLVNNANNADNLANNIPASSSLSVEPATLNTMVGNFQNNLNIENSSLANNIPTSESTNVGVTYPTTGNSITNNFTSPIINQLFSVGDKVKITLSIDLFKQMQEGHGGWNYKMTELVGKIGTIHRVTGI